MDSQYTKSLVFNTCYRNNYTNSIQNDLSSPVFYLNTSIKDVVGYTVTNFVAPNTFLTIDVEITWFGL